MSAETVGLPLTERSLWLVNESGTWEGSGAVPSADLCGPACRWPSAGRVGP